jgi:hypothetical protein
MNYHFLSVAARTAAGIGALALAGAGCGTSAVHRGNRPLAVASKPAHGPSLQRLTAASLETQISTAQQRIGLSVRSVHCPRTVQILAGRTFTCVTTLAKGSPISTTVTPTNATLGLVRMQFPLPRTP